MRSYFLILCSLALTLPVYTLENTTAAIPAAYETKQKILALYRNTKAIRSDESLLDPAIPTGYELNGFTLRHYNLIKAAEKLSREDKNYTLQEIAEEITCDGHWFAKRAMIALLLRAGADPNSVSISYSRGDSLLYQATVYKDLELAKMLLPANGSKTFSNPYKSPLFLNPSTDFIKLFFAHCSTEVIPNNPYIKTSILSNWMDPHVSSDMVKYFLENFEYRDIPESYRIDRLLRRLLEKKDTHSHTEFLKKFFLLYHHNLIAAAEIKSIADYYTKEGFTDSIIMPLVKGLAYNADALPYNHEKNLRGQLNFAPQAVGEIRYYPFSFKTAHLKMDAALYLAELARDQNNLALKNFKPTLSQLMEMWEKESSESKNGHILVQEKHQDISLKGVPVENGHDPLYCPRSSQPLPVTKNSSENITLSNQQSLALAIHDNYATRQEIIDISDQAAEKLHFLSHHNVKLTTMRAEEIELT